jgi:hypothetical protein
VIDMLRNGLMYFTNVLALNRGFAIVGGHLYSEGSSPQQTIFFRVEAGGWKRYLSIQQLVYACDKRLPSDGGPVTISLLARDGQYIENQQGKGVTTEKMSLVSSGSILALVAVGGDLFACGDMYQVYHRGLGQNWILKSTGLPSVRLFDTACLLTAIDAFSPSDVYAVGSSGGVWHWDGVLWRQQEQLTNLHLYSVHCARDGYVYVGGGGGLLLKGRAGMSWENIGNPAVSTHTFHSITGFGDFVYIAADKQLLISDGVSLDEQVVPLSGKKAFYRVDDAPDCLWCVGDECVFSFDGNGWMRYDMPAGLV